MSSLIVMSKKAPHGEMKSPANQAIRPGPPSAHETEGCILSRDW
jgi:hypothetical protein